MKQFINAFSLFKGLTAASEKVQSAQLVQTTPSTDTEAPTNESGVAKPMADFIHPYITQDLRNANLQSGRDINLVCVINNRSVTDQDARPFPARSLDELTPNPPETEGNLKSLVSDRPTRIMFLNDTNHQVSLYWINYSGTRVLYKKIGPGEEYWQQTFVSHPWIACGPNLETIAVFLPKSNEAKATIRTQALDELAPNPPGTEGKAKSLVSDQPTSVIFLNDTNCQVSLYWINYSGTRVLYKKIRPGEEYRQQTFVSHPWIACGPNSETIAMFLPKSNEAKATIRLQNELSVTDQDPSLRLAIPTLKSLEGGL